MVKGIESTFVLRKFTCRQPQRQLTTGRTFRIVCDQTFLSRAWEMLEEMAEEP